MTTIPASYHMKSVDGDQQHTTKPDFRAASCSGPRGWPSRFTSVSLVSHHVLAELAFADTANLVALLPLSPKCLPFGFLYGPS